MASLLSCCAAQLACEAATCCVGIGCRCCCSAVTSTVRKSTVTRVVYLVIFLLLCLVAWILNLEQGQLAIWATHLPKEFPSANLMGVAATYRVCAALAVFHLFFAVVMIGVRSSRDPRAILQDGLWFIKVLFLIGLLVGAFFLDAKALVAVGWVAFAGAAVFIVLQLVVLIEAAYAWNASMVRAWEETANNNWYYFLLTCTGLLYAFVLGLTIAMYAVYCTGGGCGLNIFFNTFNLIAVVVFSVLAVSPAVQHFNAQSGLIQAGVVAAYSTYLVLSALMSEDANFKCVPKTAETNENAQQASLILGALFTIVTVCYSAMRLSMSSEALSLQASSPTYTKVGGGDDDLKPDTVENDEEVDGVVYSYSYFHLTFALAASYMLMLLTNWSVLGQNHDGLEVNTGAPSVWVKMISSWITILLYVWTLIAPICFPDRDFGHY